MTNENDEDVYLKYPRHRKWFNKLYVAELFGYKCGPAGVDIPEDGTYVVRPVYNLSGMGVGAEVKDLLAGDFHTVQPGYFWCEYLTGNHYSVDYTFKVNHKTGGEWVQTSCYQGFNTRHNLTQFIEWKKSSYIPQLPQDRLKHLSDVQDINVEFIGNSIIEIHLRPSSDPLYDHLIPVWASDLGVKKQYKESHGFEFIESHDDADGLLDDPRIGFLVK